jgi:hypothetical protein
MNHDLLLTALRRCDEVAAKWGGGAPFPSVRAQLAYLVELASGRSSDRSRLGEIILGVQAAKEIEQLDESFAELLHEISDQVRQELRLR